LLKHTSPFCVQNETAEEQTPFRQSFEQQSPAAEHPLPAVRHPPPGLTGAHLLLVQMPLQHWLARVHAPAVGLSGTHAAVAHC
jgi:hypothetical protein